MSGIFDVSCPTDHPSLEAALCYKNCPPGYNGFIEKCLATCPDDMTEIGPACSKNKTYSSGTLTNPTCPSGYHAGLGQCYGPCKDGYTDNGVGLCWPGNGYGRGAGYAGWTDKAAKEACERSNDHGAKTNGCEKCGLLWYPKCDQGFEPDSSLPIPCNWCIPTEKAYPVPTAPPICDGNTGTIDYGALVGKKCYPLCKDGFTVEPASSILLNTAQCVPGCPDNFTDIGVACSRNAGADRGFGIVPTYALSRTTKIVLAIIGIVLLIMLIAAFFAAIKIVIGVISSKI